MSELSKLTESLIGLTPWAGSFLFFLLIYCTGYIFVEIWMGRRYIFRSVLENYENSYFDRSIHYIVLWILCNVLMFSVFYICGSFELIVESFNSIWTVSNVFKKIVENTGSMQLILFWIYWFIFNVIFFACLTRIMFYSDEIIDVWIKFIWIVIIFIKFCYTRAISRRTKSKK